MIARTFYVDGEHDLTVSPEDPEAWAIAIQMVEEAIRGRPVEVHWEDRPDVEAHINFPQEDKYVYGIGGGHG